MELETLKTLNEGLYPGLMLMIEVIVLMTVCLTIAGFASHLAGIVWLCFEETRQPARRQVKKKASLPPAPDEDALLAALAALNDDLGDSLTGSVSRPALQRISLE